MSFSVRTNNSKPAWCQSTGEYMTFVYAASLFWPGYFSFCRYRVRVWYLTSCATETVSTMQARLALSWWTCSRRVYTAVHAHSEVLTNTRQRRRYTISITNCHFGHHNTATVSDESVRVGKAAATPPPPPPRGVTDEGPFPVVIVRLSSSCCRGGGRISVAVNNGAIDNIR